jgi:sulfite reductase (NADPH) flavoprotein alpha-component
METVERSGIVAPFIPSDAPFSEPQRAWLNGFLAGMFSSAIVDAEVATGAERPLLVLFGSQTGTAERLAKKFAREAAGAGFTARVRGMDECSPQELRDAGRVAVVVSTHGDGEPPDQAARFVRALCAPDAPRLDGVEYGVLALGDSTYQHFARCGRDLDARLGELGAARATERIDADVEVDLPFAQWKEALLRTWRKNSSPPTNSSTLSVSAAQTASSREDETRIVRAPVVKAERLNRPDSDKDTRHVALWLGDGTARYQVGDALGVVPRNPPLMVGEVLRAAGYDGEEAVPDPDGRPVALRRALTEHYAIGRLSARTLRDCARACGDPWLRAVCNDPETLSAYLEGRDLIDLLQVVPRRFFEPSAFIAVLPRLRPRLFSIASSPEVHHAEVHICVGVVRYRAHGRERLGVCSTFIAERARPGETLEVFIQRNERFRPPPPDVPVIMIGPGTGIAPFRAFLAQRRAAGAAGRNWLFFGDRHRATDFLYEDELLAYERDGFLRLSLAFSRDQHHKIYVQHRMLESATEFWRWLENGASVYVCGDAEHMARDVDVALRRIVELAGGYTVNEATAYVEELATQGRYRRDVY